MAEFLYHNKGDGTFEELGLVSEVAVDIDGRTYAGMGVDFADYNNDGWPDLVVTDLANQRYALYQNNGDGSFNYASSAAGIGQMTLSHSGWGVRFFDYDNDGWKDLLIAQGSRPGHDRVELSKSALSRTDAAGSQHRSRICGCFHSVGRRFPSSMGLTRTGHRRSRQRRPSRCRCDH